MESRLKILFAALFILLVATAAEAQKKPLPAAARIASQLVAEQEQNISALEKSGFTPDSDTVKAAKSIRDRAKAAAEDTTLLIEFLLDLADAEKSLLEKQLRLMRILIIQNELLLASSAR